MTSRGAKPMPGSRWGRLEEVTWLGVLPEHKSRQSSALYRCDCGTEKPMFVYPVRAGKNLSCGCYSREAAKTRSLRHGHAVNRVMSPEYAAWRAIIERCGNKNLKTWERYGGRGIRVFDGWRDSFEEFLSYVGPRPSGGHSLDRIDNDGDYAPGNVRWATRAEQARNRSNTRMVTLNGETMCVQDWANRASVCFATMSGWLKRWPEEKVLARIRLEGK